MFLTFRYRIKDKSARKALLRHAWAVNQVWNYCAAYQRDIEDRYKAGAPERRWPTHFDLTGLTAGVTKELGIHAGTVGEVCRQFTVSRKAVLRAPRFRVSAGPRRSLGWVPFRIGSRQINGNVVTYLRRQYRVFGTKRRPIPETSRGGHFVEDARGRWYVCLQVEVDEGAASSEAQVGIDLGLKSLATLSTGEVIENPRHLRQYAERLAIAQRAGNKRRSTAIHAKIANARKDHLHKASSAIARSHKLIVVGNLSAAQLKKTWLAKSVSDASWYVFCNQLRYKASRHGARYVEVDERWTSQTCSSCGVIPSSSPKGTGALGMRAWVCSECGASHDRDVNAAKNILRLGLSVEPHADESQLAA